LPPTALCLGFVDFEVCMIFEIHNIGKIQEASIEMRGMTIIAGNNNTGKSTYGKALYCMFSVFRNSKTTIHEERERAIEDSISEYFNFPVSESRIKILVNNIIANKEFSDGLRHLLEEAIGNKIISIEKNKNDTINSIVEMLIRSGKVADEEIQKTILARFLKAEFKNKIIHVNHAEEAGVISLKIKGNILSASIKNNECSDFIDNVGIVHKVFYIDTPFILDEIDRDFPRFISNGSIHRAHLLRSLSKSVEDVGVVEEILAKQQLLRIFSNIRSAANGEFKRLEGDWMFQEDGLDAPLGMSSLSAGMKPFLIIKRLLEAGEIKELDVLVLDEPEIHLHPDWQLKYAELLVLLQKEFNLNILLTTHSPYLLNAIEVYSQRNNIADHCNYYLTDTQGDVCTIQEVTGNLDLAYQKLARPFQELENLRYRED
jgi:predicted ATPase